MSVYVLTKLKEMREELDTLINLVECSNDGKKVITHFTQLNVGDTVELASDYDHQDRIYGSSVDSLPKGYYVVDMVESDDYEGSLNVSFASANIWYNFENIRRQTQILKVGV